MCVCFNDIILNMFKIMYDPNNIVVGVTILFLIGYSVFLIRKMYNKRINELEEQNNQQKVIIANLENQYKSELGTNSNINNIERNSESCMYDSTLNNVINNVLPSSLNNTVDVIIKENSYDMTDYSEELDKSDIRKVVEKIIANTSQEYTNNELVIDEVDEVDEVDKVNRVDEVNEVDEIDEVDEVDEIDEVDEVDEVDKIKLDNKSNKKEKNVNLLSEKEINNLKVLELKEILDKHGKSYSSDLKKKDLKEIVLTLSNSSESD